VALITCQSTPLLLLGIDPQAYVSYTLFASVYGQLQHCNVVAPSGRVLDWIFSTPGIPSLAPLDRSARGQPQLRRYLEPVGPRLRQLLPATRP